MSLSLPRCFSGFLTVLLGFSGVASSGAEVRVVQERLAPEEAGSGFELKTVPRPALNDLAAGATFRVLQGNGDPNGGDVAVLHDGRVPGHEDAPAQNFFFRAGGGGGRLLVDLHDVRPVARVSTYSWHAGERGPQVYDLYAADGTEVGFSLEIGEVPDPTTSGWIRLATVDTQPPDGENPGGQYGVNIAASEPASDLGRFRYLLFVVRPTRAQGPFGQTFFSEIDVVDRHGPALQHVGHATAGEMVRVVELDGGETRIIVDASATPDLQEWVDAEVLPLVREWYPELRRMLPSPGYEAPRQVRVVFVAEGDGVAATSGTKVTCWAKWFRANLKGEAKGAILHELVHVVQQYGRARSRDQGGSRPPGWLVEGIPDYIRWFRYEARSGGALISPAAAARVRYDGSYRITANFLHWVTSEYGPGVYRELNAAMREGRYQPELWKELTEASVDELGTAWKADLARQRADGANLR
jgi:hypothetical protein